MDKKIENVKFKEFSELSEKEKVNYILWEWFEKVRKKFILELDKKANKYKNKWIDFKLFIAKLKTLNPKEIIDFKDKVFYYKNWEKKETTAVTIFINQEARKIVISRKILELKTETYDSIELLLYHELNHFIWRDNIEYNNNFLNQKFLERISKRELSAKIAWIRKILTEKYGWINIEQIKKLFSDWEKSICQNNFSIIEQKEIGYIYNIFKDKEEILLVLLEKFVSRDILKQQINSRKLAKLS